MGHAVRRELVLVITSVLLVFSTPASAEQFDSIEDAVAFAESELDSGELQQHAAIVFRYSYDDETKDVGKVRLYCGGGYSPKRANPDTINVEFVRICSQALSIRIDQRGFNQAKRTFEAAPGDVFVFDDIVLQRVSAHDASEVTGRIILEGDPDLGGLKIWMEGDGTTTDADGYFRFESVPTGEKYISVSAPGYARVGDRLTVKPRSKHTVTLRGYLKRTALVRWAYQPKESRDMANGLVGGETIFGEGSSSKFSWVEGDNTSRARSDLVIRQIKDQLFLAFNYQSRHGPGAIRLAGITFEEVLQAPRVDYPGHEIAMNEGDIFLLKSYDGKHYGKIECLAIELGAEGRERLLSKLARTPTE